MKNKGFQINGRTIVIIRTIYGITQSELAEKSNIWRQDISRFENGHGTFNEEKTIRLLNAMNVEMELVKKLNESVEKMIAITEVRKHL